MVFVQADPGSASVDAKQGTGLVVEDARPVAKAMALLSRQLGWNITYEEAEYLNTDDLRLIENGDRRVAFLRPGLVRLPDEAGMAQAQQDPVALLEWVIGTEETSRGAVKRFKVLRSASMLHVVPAQVLDAAGRWQTAVPIFDTEITISHGAVNLSEFLEILCGNLSAVGPTKIITATMPITAKIPRGSARMIIVPAQQRTARVRTLLIEALSKAQVPLKWMLMYDPPSGRFYLSIGHPGDF